MAIINLIPDDGVAVIDDVATFGMDYTGLDLSIHAIHWNNTQGVIQYKANSVTGEAPANTFFSDLTPYQSYVTAAQAKINAEQNPVSYYATQDGVVVGDITYFKGDEIIQTEVGWPPPALNTTLLVPPVVTSAEAFNLGQRLYWTGSIWTLSFFDINLTLTQAKAQLILKTETAAANNMDNQTRHISILNLLTAADPTILNIADYAGFTLGQYQTYLDGEVASKVGVINAATAVADLYSYDPRIDEDPNP